MRLIMVLAALTLSLIFLITASNAAGDDFPLSNDDLLIRSSVNYLLSCQNPDGGFGGRPGNPSDLLTTSDVAMALFRTGDINLTVKGGKTILDYLIKERPPASSVSAGDLGRYIMGVVAAGGDPRNLGGSDYVSLLKYRARQAPEAYPSSVAYVLLGFIAADEEDSVEAKAYARSLESKQLASGGWGDDSSSPDTNATGLAICALIGAGEDVNATWMKKALTWLESAQNDNGGFSAVSPSQEGPCSPSTELAIMGILAMGQSPVDEPWRTDEANPVNFLLSCRQPDGSIWFKSDAPGPLISRYTALGAISLTGGWLPTAISAPPKPAISVYKTANVSTAVSGDAILYTIWVNNTGNKTLSGVMADDNLTKHQEKIGSVDPGKNRSFTTTYTVKEGDIGKPIVNNVTASGIADGVVYRGFDTATVSTIYNPNIAVRKTANVTEVDRVGSVILYTIWVNNTGSTILDNIVADDSLTKHKEDIGSLDPGKNRSFTTTYTVKAADLGTSIVNKVTARGTGPNGESHENSSTVTVKTGVPETISMQLMVFNDGSLVFNKTVDVFGVNLTSWDAIKQSGASYEYTDWGGDLGIFIDRLAGVGEPAWGPSFWHDGGFSEWGCSNWHIHEGELDQWIGPNSPTYLTKMLWLDSATPAAVAKGQAFRVRVTEVPDYSIIIGGPGTPSQGATVTVGFDKYITNSDGWTPEITLNKDANYCVYAEKTKCLATYWLGSISPVDGVGWIQCGAGGCAICDLTGETCSNIDVKITADPKYTESGKYADLGDSIKYTIWVNNTGATRLEGVVASDSLTKYKENIGSLEPGENHTFTTTYTVQISDIGRPIVNTVTANGKDLAGKTLQDTATAMVKTLVSLVRKTASPKEALPLTNIMFTIVVTDTYDEDLHDVTVHDSLPTGLDYVSDNRSGTVAGSNIIWNLGDLGRGESAFIELVAQIRYDATGTLNNTVKVTASPGNVDESNYELVKVVDERNTINVIKTADKSEAKRGEEVNYTIRVNNALGMPLHNVVVKDVFNKPVELVSASPTSEDGIWRFPEISAGSGVTINLTVKVPEAQNFEFSMAEYVTGEGFMNVANDYNTSLESYVIKNCVYVTSDETGDTVFSDCRSVTVSSVRGTALSIREHGSGSYKSDELVRMRTENKSISMDKDMSAIYRPTAFGLYNNRTIGYSSKWTEGARAKNWVTGASMSEYYRHATAIDRESRFDLDKNGSTMDFNTTFEGTGHVGVIKTSKPHITPDVEFREDYSGSFKTHERVDEYGSSATTEKSASGIGFVSADKRVKKGQRSYEYGTGTYGSEEKIETSTNYIAKNISLEHQPHSNESLKWKEGIWSRTPGTSLIGEKYTDIDRLNKETVASGLNEIQTEAEFSGAARYRAVHRNSIDIDQSLIGDYSIKRHLLIEGVPKFDHPHLVVKKSGDLHYEDEAVLAKYSITLENDGDRSLAPIYVKDIFPPLARYINSSIRPSELTAISANWTLTHLAIGDRSVIDLWLDVTDYAGDELVNRVEASGVYNDTCVTAINFTALEIDWLTSNLARTVAVSKSAELIQDQPNAVRYNLTIQNLEESTRVARVTDPLPQGMRFLDASVTPSSDYDGVLTWNLIELGPFETKTIIYEAEALRSGTFVNRAEVDVRAVNGTSVLIQYATAIIDVGGLNRKGSAADWQSPAWGFNLTCEDCDLEPSQPTLEDEL